MLSLDMTRKLTKTQLPPAPYERQPKESSAAYAAFVAYRDLHPIERSYSRVEAELGADVREWARVTDWASRASAWDDHRDTVVRASELTALAEMRSQQLDILRTGHAIVVDQIELLGQAAIDAINTETGERVNLIGPTEIRQWIDSMIKLKALFAGEPTEIQKVHSNEELDLSKLSIDELKVLKSLQKKIKGEE